MAPVQTFSSSPITAAKAPGPTTTQSPMTSKTATAATTSAAPSSAASNYGPPSAQQGSRPLHPSAALSASSPQAPRPSGGHVQPTPTQPLLGSNHGDNGQPPAPQPGAVPTPPGAESAAAAAPAPAGAAQAVGAASKTLPPPPRKGETLGPEHTTAPSAAYPPPTAMPAQMSYPPPAVSRSVRGTATDAAGTFASPYEAVGGGGGGGGGGPVPRPVGTGLGGGINLATDMSHPPGYQQDAHAAEFSSGQRAAHDAYVAQHSDFGSSLGMGAGGGGDGEGSSIWNAAKKWASAAGDTLAAAEEEVWKAVNKDQK